MAAGYNGANIELQQADTFPLLMDNNDLQSSQEHSVTILPGSSEGHLENEDSHAGTAPSAFQNESTVGTTLPAPSAAITTQPQQVSMTQSSARLGSFGGRQTNANNYGVRQRTSPFNSGLCRLIEFSFTVCQIIASIIVLSLSRDEKPRAPLSLWVAGYAAGCLAMLPLLYWRHNYYRAHQPEHNPLTLPEGFPSNAPSSPQIAHHMQEHTSSPGEQLQSIEPMPRRIQVRNSESSSVAVHMERCKIALDCFFAVWFVVGNVWVFGGHSSSHEAPNLYRLCIVFLTFSCIGYAMPFILCATVCCCLPCLTTLLGYREAQGQAKGAAPEIIDGLPIYKFKMKGSNDKGHKDASDSDCESPVNSSEGGTFAAGTERERFVSGEDAVCCICLGKYKDGVDLKELPCSHFFHVECVDKWLKINASCPLCKLELGGSSDSVGAINQ